MLEPIADSNSKTPENQAEPDNQAETSNQDKPKKQAEPNGVTEPNGQAKPDGEAEPSGEVEPNDESEQNDDEEMAPEGLWANLSTEKKRWVIIGAIVIVAVAVILFATHRSPEAAKKAPAPTPAQVAAQTISNAEKTAMNTPTPENFVNLSVVYYNAKRYYDCVLAARKAISLKPNFPEAYNNIAAGFLQLSAWDSAITAANEAIRLKPDFQLAKNNLAGAIQGKKSLEENIAKLQKTASEKPTPENYLDLSAAYFQDSQFDKCIAAARKAITLRPDFAAAYNNICVAYNRLGRWEDGKKAGEEAIRLDPNNQLAKNNLQWSIDEINKKEATAKK